MLKVKRSKKNRVEAFDVDDPDLDEKLDDAIQRARERVEEESRRLAEELEDWNPDPDLRGHRNRTSGGRMLRIPRPARFFFCDPQGNPRNPILPTSEGLRIKSIFAYPSWTREIATLARVRTGNTHARGGGGLAPRRAYARDAHTRRVSICGRNAWAYCAGVMHGRIVRACVCGREGRSGGGRWWSVGDRGNSCSAKRGGCSRPPSAVGSPPKPPLIEIGCNHVRIRSESPSIVEKTKRASRTR